MREWVQTLSFANSFRAQCATVPKREPLGLEGPQNCFYRCIVKLSFSSLRIGSRALLGLPSQGSRQKILIFSTFFPGRMTSRSW